MDEFFLKLKEIKAKVNNLSKSNVIKKVTTLTPTGYNITKSNAEIIKHILISVIIDKDVSFLEKLSKIEANNMESIESIIDSIKTSGKYNLVNYNAIYPFLYNSKEHCMLLADGFSSYDKDLEKLFKESNITVLKNTKDENYPKDENYKLDALDLSNREILKFLNTCKVAFPEIVITFKAVKEWKEHCVSGVIGINSGLINPYFYAYPEYLRRLEREFYNYKFDKFTANNYKSEIITHHHNKDCYHHCYKELTTLKFEIK